MCTLDEHKKLLVESAEISKRLLGYLAFRIICESDIEKETKKQ